MTRRLLVAVSLFAAALAALPAPAPAKAKKRTPKITLVSPMRVKVGATLTIRGRGFNKTARRNTVVFGAPDGRSALAKPIRATSKRLVVKVPAAVERMLSTSSGKRIPTRLRLRVVARGLSSKSLRRLSPVIVPAGSAPAPKPKPKPKKQSGSSGGTPVAPAGPPPPCGSGSDWDGDLLSNSLEGTLGTDPCRLDTDGDGVEDGFEYRSAVDLNDDDFQEPNGSLPYPGKRNYPNPLDGSDGGTDYDGDSLSDAEEQTLWRYTIDQGASRDLNALTYSGGEKYSMLTRGPDGRRTPTLAAAGYSKQTDFLNSASTSGYRQVMLENRPPWTDSSGTPLPPGLNLYGLLDFNRDGTETAPPGLPGYFRSEAEYYDLDNDGWLSDNERDEDGDGLTNFDEKHGRLTPGYWAACYAMEAPFRIQYAGTGFTDPDSDGDGIRDGADDQDHDDIPNVAELSRNAGSGLYDGQGGCKPAEGLPAPPDTHHPDVYGRVHPLNPCLPAVWSRTCDEAPLFGNGTGAPFDGSPDWYSLN